MDNYITGSPQNTNYLSQHYKINFHFIYHDVSRDWSILELNTINYGELKFIFHLASPASVENYQAKPIETMWANSVGLKNALDFADKKKARLIFSSTSEIYGSALNSPQKETYWGNVNPHGERSCYDESKRFGEALIFSSNRVNSTQHGLVRIFNTYGPRMNESDDRVINSFIKNALLNKDLVIFGSGQQTRSFCYIDDLISGIINYAESSLTIPINLGTDVEISINQLAELVIKITKSNSKIVYKGLPADDPPQRRPDLSLANKYLAYSHKVGLDQGLKIFSEWKKKL